MCCFSSIYIILHYLYNILPAYTVNLYKKKIHTNIYVYASPDGNSIRMIYDVKKCEVVINEDVNEDDIFVLSRINVLHEEKIQKYKYVYRNNAIT